MRNLFIKKFYPDAKIPERAHPTDSGTDVFAYRFECRNGDGEVDMVEVDPSLQEIILNTNDRVLINTGIAATVGSGFEIQVRPRSGLAKNKGISIVNTPGTVDEGFRDVIGVIIINTDKRPRTIKLGDKIAQLVVCPVEICNIVVVDDLNNTDRQFGGFGSTGEK